LRSGETAAMTVLATCEPAFELLPFLVSVAGGLLVLAGTVVLIRRGGRQELPTRLLAFGIAFGLGLGAILSGVGITLESAIPIIVMIGIAEGAAVGRLAHGNVTQHASAGALGALSPGMLWFVAILIALTSGATCID